ncbi:ABC transporter ATP-binding protein [Dinoroseobacter sp. S76]|uniref:ABC transporter ATP-binding protein n=1 Tax=Dinoroseobacter sp. S76 TaxID=3415124 RepID=UPI003C7E6B93
MLLEVKSVSASYGAFQALFDVDLTIAQGETVAVMGANGAGKSTLFNVIAGGLAARNGAVSFHGKDQTGAPPEAITAAGVACVPEGRRLFSSLTVEENLLMGAHCGRPGDWTLDKVFGLFPILEERRRQAVTSLSGGQQQMVSIGRAMMANPDLLMCDELSLGLAPVVIKDIYAALAKVREAGMSTLIVEQSVTQALAAADRAYCLTEGRVVLQGAAADLSHEVVADAYFGKVH